MQSTSNLPPIRLISLDSPSADDGPTRLDDRWFQVEAFLQAKSFKANTQKAYRHELNRFLQWTDRNWVEVAPRHIAQFKTHLLTQGTAPSSVNRALTALKSFFQWLQTAEAEQMHTNPASAVSRSQIQATIPRNLSEQEVNTLFTATAQRGSTALRDTAILAVLLHQLSGAEICSLNIRDYDGKYLTIGRSQNKPCQKILLKPIACQLLDKYLQQRREEIGELNEAQPLFLSQKQNQYAQRLGYQAIYYIIKAVGELAGIQDLTPHHLKSVGETPFSSQVKED